MHDIGDLLGQAGFADPVMDMEYVTLTYADAAAMLHDLPRDRLDQRHARPVRAELDGSRPVRSRWRRRWRPTRRDGRLAATFEVIYGHAWKAAPKKTAEGLPIVALRAASRAGRSPRVRSRS